MADEDLMLLQDSHRETCGDETTSGQPWLHAGQVSDVGEYAEAVCPRCNRDRPGATEMIRMNRLIVRLSPLLTYFAGQCPDCGAIGYHRAYPKES